ncbi:MAG: hypothetical protein ACRD2O_08175 [Terriglobia bacterium]
MSAIQVAVTPTKAGLALTDNHGRVWNNAETIALARLDRDNGWSGFLSLSPLKAMDV